MQIIASLFSLIFGRAISFFLAYYGAQAAIGLAYAAMVVAAWLSLFGLINLVSYTLPNWLAVAFVTLLPPGTTAMLSTLGAVETGIIAFRAWTGFYRPDNAIPWAKPGPGWQA